MISVLHVEPDAIFRDILKQRLEETDPSFHVDSVAEIIEALSKCVNSKIDLILIGHSKNFNGLEFAQSVREYSKAKVIIYTIESKVNISNSIIDVGADAYLQFERSFDQPSTIINRIKTVLEKSSRGDFAFKILDASICAVAIEKKGKIVYHNSSFEDLISSSANKISENGISSYITESEGRSLLEAGGEGLIKISPIIGGKLLCWARIDILTLLGEPVLILNIGRSHPTRIYESQLSLLNNFAPKILGSRTIKELINNTFEVVQNIVDSEIMSFFIVEGEELVCIERVWKGTNIKLPLLGENSLTRSVKEGISINLSNDLMESIPALDISPQSDLTVPIKDDEIVIAAINFRSSRPYAFTDVDTKIIESLCLFVGCSLKVLTNNQTISRYKIQYSNMLDSLSEMLFVIVNSEFLYVNRTGAIVLRYEKPLELLGKDIYSCIAPDYKELIKRIIEQPFNQSDSENHEIKLIRKDGSTILAEVGISKILFEGKNGYLVKGKDITIYNKMKEQLKNYTNNLEKQIDTRTKELVEMQQFASAGKIASMVGHDLRSPLQSIRNATYLLRKQPERTEEILKSVDLSVDRALSMLEELRYKTRDTPLKIEQTKLNELIIEILKDIPIPESVKLDVNLDQNIEIVQVDLLKFRRVIDNLVRNAIEAMPNGGKLSVATENEGEDYAVLITDTGVGIPQENLPSLFKPFYTTKEKGLGLGLAYSLKTIEAHGGIIEVDSKVGEGTTFRISLNKNTISSSAMERKK